MSEDPESPAEQQTVPGKQYVFAQGWQRVAVATTWMPTHGRLHHRQLHIFFRETNFERGSSEMDAHGGDCAFDAGQENGFQTPFALEQVLCLFLNMEKGTVCVLFMFVSVCTKEKDGKEEETGEGK